jgi:maleamate amidohydrolase
MDQARQYRDDETWGRRIGFGAHPLLLIIDFTRAFTEPGRPLAADCSAEIRQTNLLIAAARAADVPVMFTAVAYESPDLSDAGLWARKIGGQTDLMAGTAGVEIDPRLRRESGDGVLYKKYASCFFGTDLVSRLNAVGRDTLILAGLTSSGCVRATAVDAIQWGFRPIVVREAVGDRWPDAHAQALRDLDAKYADVMAIKDVLAHLGEGGARLGA